MSSSVILNSSNIVPNTNNSVLRYKFNGSMNFDEGSQIAVLSIDTYNSVFNIDYNLYNNNTFYYYWFDMSGNLITSDKHAVILPDGNYTTSTLSEAFKAVMLKNKHYLVSSADPTKYLFFYDFIDNPVSVKCRLSIYALKSTFIGTNKWLYPNGSVTPLAGTWSAPTGKSVYGRVEFPEDTISGMSKFLGFTGRIVKNASFVPDEKLSRTYPSTYGLKDDGTALDTSISATALMYEGETIPVQLPISSIIVTSNLCKNQFSNPDNVLHSFTMKSASGYLNTERPNFINWMQIARGSYQYVEITFLDQNMNKINLRDPQILVQLLFRQVNNN